MQQPRQNCNLTTFRGGDRLKAFLVIVGPKQQSGKSGETARRNFTMGIHQSHDGWVTLKNVNSFGEPYVVSDDGDVFTSVHDAAKAKGLDINFLRAALTNHGKTHGLTYARPY
eukprot:g59055.t1